MNEGVWVRGAAHEEFVCEMVDELADWDHLEVSVKFDMGVRRGKSPITQGLYYTLITNLMH